MHFRPHRTFKPRLHPICSDSGWKKRGVWWCPHYRSVGQSWKGRTKPCSQLVVKEWSKNTGWDIADKEKIMQDTCHDLGVIYSICLCVFIGIFQTEKPTFCMWEATKNNGASLSGSSRKWLRLSNTGGNQRSSFRGQGFSRANALETTTAPR